MLQRFGDWRCSPWMLWTWIRLLYQEATSPSAIDELFLAGCTCISQGSWGYVDHEFHSMWFLGRLVNVCLCCLMRNHSVSALLL